MFPDCHVPSAFQQVTKVKVCTEDRLYDTGVVADLKRDFELKSPDFCKDGSSALGGLSNDASSKGRGKAHDGWDTDDSEQREKK